MREFIVEKDDYAFYDNFFGMAATQEYVDCKIVATPGKYDFKPLAYGFQKDSPYLYLFNHFINEKREKGSMASVLTKYETGAQICPDYSGKSLGISTCIGAFIVLIIGVILCGCLFVVEKLSWSILGITNLLDDIIKYINDSNNEQSTGW